MQRIFPASLIVLCLAASVEAAGPSPGKVECHLTPEEDFCTTYWTRARMEAASAWPLPVVPPDRHGTLSSTDSSAEQCQPSAPAFEVDITAQPYASAGRLFFHAGGEDFWCTAQFAESKRTVLTAAHCVRSPVTPPDPLWHSKLCFVRGYTPTSGQKVRPRAVAVWQKYAEKPSSLDLTLDYAFLSTVDHSDAGFLPLGTPDSHSYWLAIGFAENFHQGKKMVQTMGPKSPRYEAGLMEMLGNKMKDGASGGAWIAHPSPCCKCGNTIVGLTTFRHRVTCERNSPHFDERTLDLVSKLQKQCVRGTAPPR